MVKITDADKARYRAAVNASLLGQVQVERTGQTLDARIDTESRELMLPHLPRIVRLRQWAHVLAYDADVQVQDNLTDLATNTPYTAISVERGNTVESERRAWCARRTYSTTSLLPVPPNAQVTFSNPLATGDVEPITADVFVYPADDDIKMYGLDPAFKWVVLFDPTLAYTDTELIKADNELRSATILGTKTGGMARSAAISSPRRTLGMLPVATAYFKDGS